MSHTQKKEINKIPLGSMDFFVVPWTGTIPEDKELEVEFHLMKLLFFLLYRLPKCLLQL